MLNAKLIVVGGETKTTEVKLKLPATIGRGRGASLLMQHALVSREHCEIYEAGGRLWVKDLGSTNGTYVNSQKITEAELPPDELLTIGTVTFRAVYEPEEAALPPTGARPTTGTIADMRRTVSMNDGGAADGGVEIEEIPSEPLYQEEGEPELPPVRTASQANKETVEEVEEFEEIDDGGMSDFLKSLRK